MLRARMPDGKAAGRVDKPLLFLLLLTCLLRLVGITSEGLWLDEYTSLSNAGESIASILRGEKFDSHTPPFYYLVLHFWFSFFGESVFALRALSTLFDCANVLLLTIIFQSQFSRTVGLLAGVLYCFSAYAIYYAQEGRMYSLLALLVLATYGIALDWRRNGGAPQKAFLLLLVATAGMYTHYYYTLSLASLTAGFLCTCFREQRPWGSWVLVMIGVGIAYLPWVSVIFGLIGSGGQPFREHVFSVLPYTLFRFVAGYGLLPVSVEAKADFLGTISQNFLLILLYTSSFAFALLLGIRYLLQTRLGEAFLFLFSLLGPPLLALCISFFIPLLSERYLIVSFPFFLGLLAHFPWISGTKRSLKMFSFLLFALWFLALGEHFLSPTGGKTQWREAARIIEEDKERLATKVFVFPSYVQGLVQYYLSDKEKVRPLLLSSEQILPEKFWLVERGTHKSFLLELQQRGYKTSFAKTFPKENGVRLFYLIKSSE